MFISKIRAKNFRHLKDSTLTIDDIDSTKDSDKDKHQLSLLIGRNNSGKTSFLVLLEKFYAGKPLDFYDFPVSLRDDLLAFNQDSDTNKLAIQLFIEIQYTKEDSLDNLSSFILDLEPDIFQANIFFECTVNKKRLLDALDKITTSKEKFIKNNISNYLESKVYAFEKDEDLKAENRGQNLILRDIKDVRKLINLHIIHAKRNVSSSDSDVGKGTVLSKLSMDFYNGESEDEVSELNVINQSIADLDEKLNEIYRSFFDSFLKKAKNVLGLENLCVVSEKRYTTYIQSSQNDQILRETINNEVYAAPGKYSETAVKAKQQLLEDHQNYCTQSQVDSGLCKSVGKKPGMDLNAATLFTLSDSDGDTYNAKVAFVNNIVGAADPMIPKSQAKTPAAQNYVLMKSQNDALISPAITTLKSIQLDFSGANSVEGGKGTPVAKQFQDEVKRYAGNSPEYTQWSKVLSAQTERGLLVEQLKMKALDLSLAGKKYREYERMEAQLASLVALKLKNGGASTSVRKAGLQAEQNEIKRKTN